MGVDACIALLARFDKWRLITFLDACRLVIIDYRRAEGPYVHDVKINLFWKGRCSLNELHHFSRPSLAERERRGGI
jgi:hypothetical protein